MIDSEQRLKEIHMYMGRLDERTANIEVNLEGFRNRFQEHDKRAVKTQIILEDILGVIKGRRGLVTRVSNIEAGEDDRNRQWKGFMRLAALVSTVTVSAAAVLGFLLSNSPAIARVFQ